MHPSVLNIMHSRNNAWVVLGRKIQSKDFISTPEMEAFLQAPLKALNGDDYPGKKETIKYILESKDCREHLEELRQGFFMDHLHREYKRSSDWTNLPFILLTEEQIQKRKIMARIQEHNFVIESRDFDTRLSENPPTYQDLCWKDFHRTAIFSLFGELMEIRQAEMKEYVQLIVDESRIEDEHKLGYLRWSAESFFWSQDIPPR